MKLAICQHCEQPLLKPNGICPRCEMRNHSGHTLLWSALSIVVVVLVAAAVRLLFR